MMSEGIYRKNGVLSRVTTLLEQFRSDARSQCLREGVNFVDDVSSTLKRFFRELEDGLFTSVDAGSWLSTAGKVFPSNLKGCPHASMYVCIQVWNLVLYFQPSGMKVRKFPSTKCCWTDCLLSTKQHYRPSSTTCTGENPSLSSPPCTLPAVSLCSSVCFSVQRFSQCNQMNVENLAMVFGPTLFKNDGQDSNTRHAIVDLIHHYKDIFEV